MTDTKGSRSDLVAAHRVNADDDSIGAFAACDVDPPRRWSRPVSALARELAETLSRNVRTDRVEQDGGSSDEVMMTRKRTIKVEQAAVEAETRAISIDGRTLARLARTNGSIWTAFYDWIVASGYSDKRERLFGRVRVGRRLMSRLVKCERQILRRVHNLRGEMLERSLWWSDFGSGPLETSPDGLTLIGDAFYITENPAGEPLGAARAALAAKERGDVADRAHQH